MDYLEEFTSARQDEIRRLRLENTNRLQSNKKGFVRYRKPFESVRHIRAEHLDLTGDSVIIGSKGELPPDDQQKVYDVLRDFMPWRKGPYTVFGIEIDAEWQSCRKWDRVVPALPDLKDKVIADIGCSNGYYMFRMARHKPRWVIGFEPYLLYYYTFQTLNSFAGLSNLQVELFGVEQISLYENCFDVVFLMGILYHRSSPIEALRDIRKAMRPGGTLIVESQGIPGNDPVALFPEKTYAKVPGTYFVPTPTCLENWLTRAGFCDVEIFFSHPMSNLEQRQTDWMEFESYDDFIDPGDPGKTVEGYPAPIRVFLKGRV